ncbi:MAG TPA: hypothetical protein VM711_09105, partial [Sphingomicrobium sp.]|nr:hypothetical protein [Sphingomicrobium sp.]
LAEEIAAANAAGLHLDANLAWSRRRNIPLGKFKVALGFRNLHYFHFLPFTLTSVGFGWVAANLDAAG